MGHIAMPKPKLSISLVCSWIQIYHQLTGSWPSQLSGKVHDVEGESWRQIDQALRLGHRGLPGGTSLPQIIEARFNVRPRQARTRPQLSISTILFWAQDHWLKTGNWPIVESGPILGKLDENWRRIDSALKYGLRGLPRLGGLRRLVDDYRRTFEGISMPISDLRPQKPGPRRPRRYTPIQIYEVMNHAAVGKRAGKTEAQTLKELGLDQRAVGRWRRKYGASWLDSLRILHDTIDANRLLNRQVLKLKQDCKLKSAALKYALPGSHSRRRCVDHLVRTEGVVPGVACRIVGQNQSTQRNVPRAKRPLKLEQAVEETSRRHPKYGIARIQALMTQEGWQVSMNTVATIRRRLHLASTGRQRRSMRRRHGLGSCSVLPARERDQVWTYDILHDRDINGNRFKILSVLDEYTRECHSLLPLRRIRSVDVAHELLILTLRYGAPAGIRSDNAKELTAGRVRSILQSSGIKAITITRASPWENAIVEAFHSSLRSELLNEVALDSMKEYQGLLDTWKEEYNQHRPHHALGYMAPAAFASGCPCAVHSGEQLKPQPIPMRNIRSTWIRAIGYDADTSVMQVRFVSDEVFRYFGVSAKEYEQLANSSFPGRYFRDRFVRTGGVSEVCYASLSHGE